MLRLVKGDQEGAEREFRKAAELDPAGYKIKDMLPNKETFFNSWEFPMWVRVSTPGVDARKLYTTSAEKLLRVP